VDTQDSIKTGHMVTSMHEGRAEGESVGSGESAMTTRAAAVRTDGSVTSGGMEAVRIVCHCLLSAVRRPGHEWTEA